MTNIPIELSSQYARTSMPLTKFCQSTSQKTIMNQDSSEISFSVIVPVYNNVQFIKRCIDSFEQQSYQYKELLIIDGGSTDGTVNILENNSKRINYWESTSDRGIYHAFNKGVYKSSGQWIIFLGSDDWLYDSNVLAKVADAIAMEKSKPSLFYGKVALVSPEGRLLEVVNKSWKKSRKSFLQVFNINHQGIFHHRNLFERNNLFDESFRLAGDYELLLRSAKHGMSVVSLDDLIVTCRQVGGLTTLPTNYIETYKEFYKARRKNNINTFPWKLHYAFITALIRVKAFELIGKENTNKIVDLCRKLSGRPPIWTTGNLKRIR
jgi:glycosyltransferase involved in cell wall biosynthesis